jgi:hypothetical protein
VECADRPRPAAIPHPWTVRSKVVSARRFLISSQPQPSIHITTAPLVLTGLPKWYPPRLKATWGLIFCLGTALGLLTSWVVSRFFDRSSYHLKLSPTGNLRHDLHLFLYEGQFALSNQFDSNSSGRIRPLIVEAKMLIKRDLLRGDRCGQFTIPGLDLRYYWNAPSRGLIWSLEQSLLIPVGLLLLLTAWFRIRLGKLQARTSHVSPQAPERQGAEKWTSGTESQNHVKPQP